MFSKTEFPVLVDRDTFCSVNLREVEEDQMKMPGCIFLITHVSNWYLL